MFLCVCVIWNPPDQSLNHFDFNPKKGKNYFQKKNNGGYVLFVHLITFLFLKNNTTKKVTYKILTVTPHQTSFFALLFFFTYTCIRIPFQTPNSFTSSRFNKQYSVQPPTTLIKSRIVYIRFRIFLKPSTLRISQVWYIVNRLVKYITMKSIFYKTDEQYLNGNPHGLR